MNIDKSQLWPKEGKLKKGLIILAIVIVGSLLITLLKKRQISNCQRESRLLLPLSVWVSGFMLPRIKKKSTKKVIIKPLVYEHFQRCGQQREQVAQYGFW